MRARGFTLIELLLVLALMALMSALVAPQLGRWSQAAQRRSDIESVRQQLESWPARAFLAGQAMVWPPQAGASDPQLQLPAGWTLEARPSLWVEANGMNRESRLNLRAADGATVGHWLWTSPAGRLQALDDDAR